MIAWSQAEPKPIIIEGRTARGGFGIFRDGDLRQPLTVNYQITGGTADGGDHTLSQSGSVTIKRGRKGVRLPVQAADDALVEGNETLVVGLTPGEGYALGSSSSAALTVGDDDAVPDLSLQGLSEEQEETPGAILAVGAERMALSLNLAGSVRFGSKAILSIASGADQIRVWSAQSGGQLLLDADRPGKKWKGENLPSTLWIEAAAPSQSAGDITLVLSFHANPFVTTPATDTVKVTAFQADLVLDGLPDEAEPTPNEMDPGAFISLNSDDDDANGMADYLDLGTVPGEDDLVAMQLNVLGLTSGTATLSIDSGADKVLVWLNPEKDGLGPILGGSVTEMTWDLGQQPGTVYIEGIAGSLAVGDISFLLAAIPPATQSTQPATNQVKATIAKVDLIGSKGSTTQPLAEKDEAGQGAPGWYINVNWDDDDAEGWTGQGWKPDGTLNGQANPTTNPTYKPDKEDDEIAGGDNDLWEFKLSTNVPLPGKVKLTFSNSVKVWETTTKKQGGQSSQVASGFEFAANNLPKTLYLEGISGSAAFKDIQLKAEYIPQGQEKTQEDVIDVTVFEVDLTGFFAGAQQNDNSVKYQQFMAGSDSGINSWDDPDLNCDGFHNAMETQGTIQPTGVTNEVLFDFKRERWSGTWAAQQAAGPWQVAESSTTWANDDAIENDEDKTPSATDHIYHIDGHGFGLKAPQNTDPFIRSALNIREWVVVELYGNQYQASNYLRWHSTWAIKPKQLNPPEYTRDAANLQTLGTGWINMAVPQ